MTDTRQRAEMFAVLRRMEADTVRMYDAAIGKAGGDMRGRLRGLREVHEEHVLTLDRLLGECREQGVGAPEGIAEALERHVMAVRDSEDAQAALARLLEAERTNAAEYAVAEVSRLTDEEARSIHRLHEEQRSVTHDLEGMLPEGVAAGRGEVCYGYAGPRETGGGQGGGGTAPGG